MKQSRSSWSRARTVIMLAVIGLIAWALFSTDRPVLAQTCVQPPAVLVNIGPAWMSAVKLTYTSGLTSGCPTTLEGFQTSGNTSDFSIQSGPAPGCIGFTWTSANLNKKCSITVTFNPTATGTRSVVITPTVSNNVSVSSLTVEGTGFTIMPSSVQAPQQYINDFALALPSYPPLSAGYGSITFDSGNATVSWTPTLQYHTSGHIPNPPVQPSPAPTPFTTGSGGPFTLGSGTPIPGASPTPSATFPLAGGALTLAAETDIGAAGDPRYVEYSAAITGIDGGICDAAITNQLDSLYTSGLFSNGNFACTGAKLPLTCCTGNGAGTCISEVAACTAANTPFSCCTGSGAGNCGPATSNLFSLIAMKESSYAQFGYEKVYGLEGLWPKESRKTRLAPIQGLYIGLMQVALQKEQGNAFASPMDTAWNWLTNTQVSQNIFSQKIYFVVTAVGKAIKLHPTLAPLTQAQLEAMVLLQYGGYVTNDTTPAYQYYSPQPSGGSWQWLLGKYVTTNGNNYVKSIYEQQTPSSATCN